MSFVLLDARPRAGQASSPWVAGHLSGALNADLDQFLSTVCEPGFDPAPLGRHPLPPVHRWARQLGLWGIGPETSVLVYDGAKGEMGACRLWWMLKAVGHGPVDVLSGGIEGGQALGLSWTTDAGDPPTPREPYPVTAWGWPTIDADQVEAFAADPSCLLIDVRSPERWRGETEPLDPVAGRIPGSINVFLKNNLDSEGRFKSAEDLRALYGPVLGDRPPLRVAVHCGSGASACATLYALHRAGFTGASLYVGSYSQWCRTGRPIATGAST